MPSDPKLRMAAAQRWWLSVPARHGLVDNLFGNTGWREGLTIAEPWKKEQFFVSEYQRSLAQSGWNGVTFRMVNERNQTQYYLVYGTNLDSFVKTPRQAGARQG